MAGARQVWVHAVCSQWLLGNSASNAEGWALAKSTADIVASRAWQVMLCTPPSKHAQNKLLVGKGTRPGRAAQAIDNSSKSRPMLTSAIEQWL
jgi:hypothetical protein